MGIPGGLVIRFSFGLGIRVRDWVRIQNYPEF